MPRRTDIKSILIIGAGPIVIGQACEFDYSGTQAVKTLRAEGYRIILVNSNPATIMTDPDLADATYIEPITPAMVEKIIEAEKPDAILPTMGGQTALNCAKALAEQGILAKHGVEMIGADLNAINKAEDRRLFNEAMAKIGLECPKHAIAHSLEEARAALPHVGLPAVIRPSFTMGGTGGGIAYNREEFDQIIASGLDASPTTEVLIDESVLGWKEFEMEVVRDRVDNCIIVCSIENIDPMGVHTGDSITVAPALTLTDKEYQRMRDASIAVLREIGVDTGGSNVQFAVDPKTGRMVVIEMNPRVSRSSALASKATGFPIAKVAALLAVGYTLDEIKNDVTKVTPASFEPTIDYIVTKVPRFAFEKFPGADPLLTTSMKSVGESMAMGRSFPESLQKALRSLETGLTGLNEIADWPEGTERDTILTGLRQPTPDRLLRAAHALRLGIAASDICAATHFDPWFIEQLQRIVEAEAGVKKAGLPNDKPSLLSLKKLGFSDKRLAELAGMKEKDVTSLRHTLGVSPVYKRVDTCAAEFASLTPYLYSCYEGDGITPAENEADISSRDKIAILGGGPNRIGQGIEFDYCCVHAAYALKEAGYETIMINCNPETVSTDYDTSDRLYFEPLTAEDVLEVLRMEQQQGTLKGVIVQFGGQTPLKLAKALEEAGIPIIGTSVDSIDLAEDRERFQQLLMELKLQQPANRIVHKPEDVVTQAEQIGYPVVVRPSYVLGGRAMAIIHDSTTLGNYVREIVSLFGDGPILLDAYLKDAIELDVDALADGESVHVAGIMEHIEEAGIHSGDSACSLPPYSLAPAIIKRVREQTVSLAKALKVRGLMNVQFAVKQDSGFRIQDSEKNASSLDAESQIQTPEIYILEVNPRASRTVPFVAKATGVAVAKIAARLMAGENLSTFKLTDYFAPTAPSLGRIAVKEAVFPFAKFPGVDVILGPEMKSTGETMGIDRDFGRAFAKAHLAASQTMPEGGKVFISVREGDKPLAEGLARDLIGLGFRMVATSGTAEYLRGKGLDVISVNKVREGRPHIVDMMKDGDIQLVINTTEGRQSIEDSFSIRRTALLDKIAYTTTMSGARAIISSMQTLRDDKAGLSVRSLQEYIA